MKHLVGNLAALRFGLEQERVGFMSESCFGRQRIQFSVPLR
jgi:hypothetical protein